jgi:hypothetical protein
MATPPATPVYKPLDASRKEIRVIELVTTSPEIACMVSTVSLDDNPCFTALSYEWGDSRVTKNITAQGQALAITANLAKVLENAPRHWQSMFPDRDLTSCKLWADAICIDQTNINEKAEQIPLMRDIYQKAELVICWLGDGNETFQKALAVFEKLGLEKPDFDMMDPFKWDVNWIGNCLDIFHDDDSHPYCGNLAWESISALLGAGYWSRTWILQERVLAQSALVACGTASTLFGHLTSIAQWGVLARKQAKPNHIGPRVWHAITRICDWEAAQKIHEFKIQLEILRCLSNIIHPNPLPRYPIHRSWEMSIYGAYHCATDPRDHIYGLLGLTNLNIDPNYAKPVRQVYLEYFVLWLDWHSGASMDPNYALKPLFLIRFSGIVSCPEMPSWVPNFPRVSLGQIPAIGQRNNGTCDDEVFSGYEGLCRIQNESLLVPAVRLEKVMSDGLDLRILGDDQAEKNSAALASYLHQLVLDESQASYNTYPRFLDAVAALFCLKTHEPAIQDVPEAATVLKFVACEGINSVAGLVSSTPKDILLSMGLEKVWTAAGLSFDFGPEVAEVAVTFRHQLSLGQFKLVETESGRIGICPTQTIPGDVVCVLWGSGIPSVLRKMQDHYLHVGTCCFARIMNGEVVTLIRSGEAQIETVEIR